MCPASGRFVWAISSVGRSNGLVCSHAQRKKNRCLTANFVHAQLRPLWTDCNQILNVGSGGRCDHWCQVLWKSVKGFRSYRTPLPPPEMPFPRLNIHRPYNSFSTVVLHCEVFGVVTQDWLRKLSSSEGQKSDLDDRIQQLFSIHGNYHLCLYVCLSVLFCVCVCLTISLCVCLSVCLFCLLFFRHGIYHRC